MPLGYDVDARRSLRQRGMGKLDASANNQDHSMPEPLRLNLERVSTPIGDFLLAIDQAGRLHGAEWADHEALLQAQLCRHHGPKGFELRPVARTAAGAAVRRYFRGELAAIDALPVAPGGTPFQHKVWRALRCIPGGETLSYAALAERIGRPTAVRAVGHANGANPISVIVPCHRVVGSDGSLTGYGGGIERKRWLLEHERRAGRPDAGETSARRA